MATELGADEGVRCAAIVTQLCNAQAETEPRTLGALSRGLAPAARMAMLSRQPSRRTLTHQLWVHDNNLSQGAHRLIDSRPPFRPCRVVCRSSGQARVLAR